MLEHTQEICITSDRHTGAEQLQIRPSIFYGQTDSLK